MARVFPPVLDLPRASSASGTIRLPGSKSLSNRLLLLAAAARGVSRIEGLLESDDTAVMLEALARLGVAIRREADTWIVQGCDGRFPVRRARLFVGNSGLSIRTLVPMVAAALSDGSGGEVVFEGVARMHERPIGDLVGGLRTLGADVRYLARPGYPPLAVHAAPLAAATVRVRGDTSSQFITGLLQAAPLLAAEAPLRIEVEGELISRPYVEITRALMARFGVPVAAEGAGAFVVPAQARYRAPSQPVAVEGDASSASYFLASGAIGGGPVRVLGAGRDSVQGDVRFADALTAMGARIQWGPDWIEAARGELRGVELDCNAIPDAAMTLAVVALHAQGDTLLRGIGSWRVKETDRIAAMAAELAKLGAEVQAGPDWLRVRPPRRIAPGAAIRTYEDHRIAMCFSLASVDGPHRAGVPLRILDPGCVAKTFPEYFERFGQLAVRPAPEATPQPALEPVAVPVIAIDGPTASGKGTVAQRVARALGWHYLDSGALYRLLALSAMRARTDPTDADALAHLARQLAPVFDGARIRLGDDDVTDAIRAEPVGEMASRIAALPAVRTALVALQQAARLAPGLVADGRDMGTVIFPDAAVKVFLTASAESRADRRTKQLIEKGFPANFDDLLQDLQARDARDTQRASAPLAPAADAYVLDSTALTIDETVEAVLSRWRAAHA